jgi:hypothetical protein
MKIIISIIALLLFTAHVNAEQPTQKPQLPQLGGGYAWQNMPMICGPDNLVLNGLKEQGFIAVNMSLGREGSDPQGQPVFLITYFINQNGNGTAATMNIPTSTDTCLLFVTHDLVINQSQ